MTRHPSMTNRRARLAGFVLVLLATPASALAAEGIVDLPKIVNFTILAAILVYLLRKPLAAYLSARAAQIHAGIEESRENRRSAARIEAENASRSDGIAAEADAAADRIREAAEQEGRRIVAAAEEQAARITAAAEEAVEAQVRSAGARIAEDAAKAVARLARARLEAAATDEDHDRLVEGGIAAIRAD